MKLVSLLLASALVLSGCSGMRTKPVKEGAAPAAAVQTAQPAALLDANGNSIETVPFRPGVSSATVETMAKKVGCTGGRGAGLLTPQGPIEVYRMQCDDGRVFKARCEMRQCTVLAIQQAMSGAVVPVLATAVGENLTRTAPTGNVQYAAPQSSHQLPRLKVRWECGDCSPSPKVIEALETAYAKAAAGRGVAVSDNVTAELTITEFRQRPPALRVLVGILAGKDVLKASLNYRGRTYQAEDYSANAWTGMNRICDVVTEDLVRQIL